MFLVRLFAVLFFFTMWVTPASAEVCDCNSRIRSQIPLFDQAVFLSKVDQVNSIEKHLPWGLPKNFLDQSNEFLIILLDYIISYDPDLNTATWAAYRLTADDLDKHKPGYVDRLDCFRDFPQELLQDPTPPHCKDYNLDSYDRGHLVNSNDMRRSRISNANTFFLINMAPQYENFNRKIWRTLEDLVNGWAVKKGKLYIITGAVFDHDGDGKRDDDNLVNRNDGNKMIAVASHFYKIVLHPLSDGSIESISILLPHNDVSITGDDRLPYLKSHIDTIGHIEELGGVNILAGLEIDIPEQAVFLRYFEAADLWE